MEWWHGRNTAYCVYLRDDLPDNHQNLDGAHGKSFDEPMPKDRHALTEPPRPITRMTANPRQVPNHHSSDSQDQYWRDHSPGCGRGSFLSSTSEAGVL